MILIPFDRSRREADEKCRRARYLNYEYQGKGLERRALNQHLAFGGAVHDAMAIIMEEVKVTDAVPDEGVVAAAIDSALWGFRREVEQRGFDLQADSLVEMDPYTGDITETKADTQWMVDQYVDLLEALVRGWVLVRLPALLADFNVVSVESEKRLLIPTTFKAGEEVREDEEVALVFLARIDAQLRRRMDGATVVLNFKTVSEAKSYWVEGWQTDQQTISEMLPVEYETGTPCAGVLIEGLVKGRQNVQWPKGSGHWYHGSPLIWAWCKQGDGFQREEWAAKYEWTDETGAFRRLGKGWERVRASQEFPGGIAAWLRFLQEREPQLLNSQFVSPPLVSRQGSEIEEWLEQVKHREVEIYESAGELARDFPKNTHNNNCLFPSRCQFYDICWGSSKDDPIGSGLYQIRQPNHPEAPEELRKLVANG